ncbi:acyl-CoA dehydrogenase family protein [Oryzicola mucosus]|uniref:Acyl-CoA dehydrogenase family protein n=1 Tax=Oryzicola mucosus TaxID=2767425 RepID=A0A8J6PKZ2_9HYPH|nr:acyl-CoA dehydrogenase family protein [Oryzicola mucosus]MBD0416719.1 acyl-CoA dehydrogenase family protein [Oryzicola mucosus]
MDLSYTPAELSFREEVRAFIRQNLPDEIRAKAGLSAYYEAADLRAWQRILNDKGWAASHWPVEYGGPGWSAVQRYIFMEEILQAPAPEPLSFNINMVGPVVYTFGSQEQKAHFLPKIRSLDYWFCQGFSEPGAGSDLASLRTSAIRDGDDYVINGQKIWTSTAHDANWMFCLVRTNTTGKKQEGISFVLIDMATPGITVRPIITIDGEHHTNEVFFDNVRVPIANRVGEENKGWDYAKFLLGNERTGIARVGLSKGRLTRAKRLAELSQTQEGKLSDDPFFRRRCIEIEVELKALEITALRIIDRQRKRNDGQPDPASSILKLRGAETQQATSELVAEVAGPLGLAYTHGGKAPWRDFAADDLTAVLGAVPNYFLARAASIYGGASEIQKNIISKAILGL